MQYLETSQQCSFCQEASWGGPWAPSPELDRKFLIEEHAKAWLFSKIANRDAGRDLARHNLQGSLEKESTENLLCTSQHFYWVTQKQAYLESGFIWKSEPSWVLVFGNSSACWWSKPVLVGHSASSEDTFSKLGIQNVLICGFHYFPSVQDQVFVREWTIAWGEMVVEDEYPFSHTSVHIWYMRWCLHSFPFTVQTASY